MNDTVVVALVQMSCGEDRAANLEKALRRAAEARAAGAELVCLQELFTGPYFPQTVDERYYSWAEPVPGPTSDRLASAAGDLGAVLVGSVFEYVQDGFFFNTALVFESDGTLLGTARKMHIPDGPGYHEKYYFTPGDTEYPVFRTSLGAIGVATCWDQWFPEVARILTLRGAELIVYPTAIGNEPQHPGYDNHGPWQTVMRGHAVANGVYVAAVNRVGAEDGLTFFGRSFVADPDGAVVADAGGDEEILIARLERDRLRETRNQAQFLRDRRPETYGGLLRRTLAE